MIVSLSPMDAQGFLTITMTNDFLKDFPHEINMSHSQFWNAMGYCLMRHNERLLIERKHKAKAIKQKGAF